MLLVVLRVADICTVQTAKIALIRTLARLEHEGAFIRCTCLHGFTEALVQDAQIVVQTRGQTVSCHGLLQMGTCFCPHLAFDAP